MAKGTSPQIDFATDPSRYRHWRLITGGPVAELVLDVDESAGLFEGYELKLNSYDLGVDIELADAVQRLRFEHPEAKAVVLRSGKDRVFCAGANIRMLAAPRHGHKVNFCKFTNETRNAIEDASDNSGQRYLCAINGTCAGGGYELALATDYIILTDDGSSACRCRRCRCWPCCPAPAGSRASPTSARCGATMPTCSAPPRKESGKRAVDWRLVDEVVPNSKVRRDGRASRAKELAAQVRPPRRQPASSLTRWRRSVDGNGMRLPPCRVEIDRPARSATITVTDPICRRRQPRGGRRRAGVLAAGWRASWMTHPASALQRTRHRRHRVPTEGDRGAGARL
jgi:benzoyl-CoA-dihydrodiol lyase